MTKSEKYDVIVLGAGASGLMCAAAAGRRGRKVLVLEGTEHAGSKILVSGGGRCNFSNAEVGPEHYISANPHFCRSALSRFSPGDFCALLGRHHIRWHEEEYGRLFCDDGAKSVLDVLLSECREAGVTIRTGIKIKKLDPGFHVAEFRASLLVIAAGGKSWTRLGATGFGYEIARQFGLNIITPAPALVPLVFDAAGRKRFGALAGLSARARVSCGDAVFEDDILFTHRGLSGPAILQISSYWREGLAVTIDLIPQARLEELAARWKKEHPKAELKNLLGEIIPKRLVQCLLENSRPVNQIGERELEDIAEIFHRWKIVPAGTEGFEKAEVTRGGVDTAEISSKTFEARKAPGLYFIGEALDVTGWLGGYNLHWAWASGHCCGLCC
ncbi:MAG: NAD(P)/FAD-dependent oxidoreductase [Kiritimatiellia bacterium]